MFRSQAFLVFILFTKYILLYWYSYEINSSCLMSDDSFRFYKINACSVVLDKRVVCQFFNLAFKCLSSFNYCDQQDKKNTNCFNKI